MTTLDRYVLRGMLAPLGASALLVAELLVAAQLLQLGDVVFGSGVRLADVLRLGLLLSPHFAVMAIPLAFLLAVMLGLGRLSQDGELAALASAGLSPWRLYRVPVAAALALGAVTAALSLWAEPLGMRAIRRELNAIIERNVTSGLVPGVFSEDLPGFTLYARAGGNGRYQGVLVDDEREGAPVLALARAGAIEAGGDDERVSVELTEGELHAVEASPDGKGAYTVARFPSGTLEIGVKDRLWSKNRFYDSLAARTLLELRAMARHARERGDDEAWARLSTAADGRLAVGFTCLAFALVGVPLAAGGRRGGRARAYLATLGLVVAYYLLARAGDALAESRHVPPAVAAWLPLALLAALGTGLAASRWRRGAWL